MSSNLELKDWQHEELKLFLDMFDSNEFDWSRLEPEGYDHTFLEVCIVDEIKEQHGSIVDTVAVFRVYDRFFQAKHTKDYGDPTYFLELGNPVEVYPYEETIVKYKRFE